MSKTPPVKAGKPIIDVLNEILSGELAAINQYFLHARMCDNWGYKRLHAKIHAESIDEMRHADQLITRILYLEGLPNVQRIGRVRIGETVPEMFECDIALEKEAIPRLKDAIALCHQHGDHGTRTLLDTILVSEEQHLDWLEEQVSLIERIGESGYLAEQIRP
jgi:bacterioferritin